MSVFESLIDRNELEQLLGIRVRTLSFYQQALLHKSAVKLYNTYQSNERLEFIGDSVLNMIIACFLYEKYPHENEGFMTKMRTRIVSGNCLSKIARSMRIHKHIRMNDKALKQGWNHNNRILEDAFEAVIGAIYCDLGLYYATQFVMKQLHTFVDFNELLIDTNYKDMLMRFTQQNGHALPVYFIVCEIGPNHQKYFVIEVSINQYTLGVGHGSSKKQGEQNAALNAMKCLAQNGV
jgi:ribonuclease-3